MMNDEQIYFFTEISQTNYKGKVIQKRQCLGNKTKANQKIIELTYLKINLESINQKKERRKVVWVLPFVIDAENPRNVKEEEDDIMAFNQSY